jgi:hypothetical protein
MFLLSSALWPCFQVAIAFVLLTWVSHLRMCGKPEEVAFDIGFQCLLGFHFEGGQNFDLPKSIHSVQTRNSSSHWQLSEIITPQSLVRLRHIGNRRKAEKVSYDVGSKGFLILQLNWGQMFKFSECPILSRIKFQQPGSTSKTHNS